MKQSIKYILIFFTCVLLGAFVGHRIFSGYSEYDDVFMSLSDQYSDAEMGVYNDAFDVCAQDIRRAHPDANDTVVVLTCQCTARRVLRAHINRDNPDFQSDTYPASRDNCYEITVEHVS